MVAGSPLHASKNNAVWNDRAPLRDCDPFVHNISLWDEASVHMVLAQRKLCVGLFVAS